MPLEFTPLNDISQVVVTARDRFNTGITRDLTFRKKQLRILEKLISNNIDKLTTAVYKDLHKPPTETLLTELEILKSEIFGALANLDDWARAENVAKNVNNALDVVEIRKEPLGVVLIIGPWNYPIQLVLAPLVGALAAGNCAILKPSEVAENSAVVLTELIKYYFDPSVVCVVNGGPKETSKLLDEQFDHIFYTGNGQVGRIVLNAAAKHLTPVTLELGGKSPVFVDANSDLSIVAKRIAWGKTVNSAQTCIAPDYIICDHRVTKQLCIEIRKSVIEMFGVDPQQSNSYARIINLRHFNRLRDVLDAQLKQEGKGSQQDTDLIRIGDFDEANLYFPFTVLKISEPASAGAEQINKKNPIMRDEIFGPILPILETSNVMDAIAYVNAGPTPLALYVFSRDSHYVNTVLDKTRSGGVCVNDTLLQMIAANVPFGGTGGSGYGAYHGRFGFDTFTHKRPILKTSQSKFMEKLNAIRYAPYTDSKAKWLKRLLFGWSDKEPSWISVAISKYWWSATKTVVGAGVFLAIGVLIGRDQAKCA